MTVLMLTIYRLIFIHNTYYYKYSPVISEPELHREVEISTLKIAIAALEG
jgi:hypothetical protein